MWSYEVNISDSFNVTEEFILGLHRESQNKTHNNKLHSRAEVHTCFTHYSIILRILAELENENKNVLWTEEVIIKDTQPAAEKMSGRGHLVLTPSAPLIPQCRSALKFQSCLWNGGEEEKSRAFKLFLIRFHVLKTFQKLYTLQF